MKTKNILVTLAVLGGLAASATTLAADNAPAKLYIGAKAGLMDADISGFDSALAAGVYGGYNMLGKDAHYAADLKGGVLAIEGEIDMTLSKGSAGTAGDWDITSYGVYGAYRQPLGDTFYLKGKFGLVHYTIDTTQPPSAAISGDVGGTTTLALGLGGGWHIGPGSLELEFTTYESNVLFTSIGFHMNF
jgi:hypothetical protein